MWQGCLQLCAALAGRYCTSVGGGGGGTEADEDATYSIDTGAVATEQLDDSTMGPVDDRAAVEIQASSVLPPLLPLPLPLPPLLRLLPRLVTALLEPLLLGDAEEAEADADSEAVDEDEARLLLEAVAVTAVAVDPRGAALPVVEVLTEAAVNELAEEATVDAHEAADKATVDEAG